MENEFILIYIKIVNEACQFLSLVCVTRECDDSDTHFKRPHFWMNKSNPLKQAIG